MRIQKKFVSIWVIWVGALILVLALFLASKGTQALVLGSPRAMAAEEKFVLRFSSPWPEMKPGAIGHHPFLDAPLLEEIEKRTNGRITFKVFAGGVFGSGREQYDIIRTGRADIGTTVMQFTPGRFPLSDALTFPEWGDSRYEYQEVAQKTYDRILYKEYPDVKMLFFGLADLPFYMQTNKPVNTVEDLKGLKIRTGGSAVTNYVLKALGAEPLSMPITEVYLSLQTGVIDGLCSAPTGLVPFKLWEVLKYEVRGFTFGGLCDCILMNLDTWNKLPNELRQIIELVIRHQGAKNEADIHWAEVPIWESEMDKKWGRNNWNLMLSGDQKTRWKQIAKSALERWIADMEAKRKPIREVITIIREECQKRNLPAPY